MNFNYFKTTLKKVNKNQPKEANKWRKVEGSLKLGSRLFLILLWAPKCGKESEVKLCKIYARPSLCALGLKWFTRQCSHWQWLGFSLWLPRSVTAATAGISLWFVRESSDWTEEFTPNTSQDLEHIQNWGAPIFGDNELCHLTPLIPRLLLALILCSCFIHPYCTQVPPGFQSPHPPLIHFRKLAISFWIFCQKFLHEIQVKRWVS